MRTATLQPRDPQPYLLKGELDAEPATEDAGLCQPCDEAWPQERGFNKRYRFLELRLGDFPEDRLCLAGGL